MLDCGPCSNSWNRHKTLGFHVEKLTYSCSLVLGLSTGAFLNKYLQNDAKGLNQSKWNVLKHSCSSFELDWLAISLYFFKYVTDCQSSGGLPPGMALGCRLTSVRGDRGENYEKWTAGSPKKKQKKTVSNNCHIITHIIDARLIRISVDFWPMTPPKKLYTLEGRQQSAFVHPVDGEGLST
jgi:hypothetical protein